MELSELTYRVDQAYENINEDILRTPLILSHVLSEMIEGRVFLKLESEQYTGSFKARGSLNKLRALSSTDRKKELITASTGNHGLGFARAVALTGTKGTVFLPEKASPTKVKRLRYYPIDLVFHPGDSLATELVAKEEAKKRNAIWISPYNDYDVIAGQGTIAIEILDQLPIFDDILITVGGGGMISGIGAYLKSKSPSIRVVSCQPINSAEMTLSLEAGRIVEMDQELPTLSDGSAGGIVPNAITFEICQKIIDETVVVSEEEIEEALRLMVHEHGKIIEGSAAVTIASLLKNKKRFKGRTVVLIICGGNIDINKLLTIL